MARPRSILYVEDPETGCWVWCGATSWNGYGRVKRDGRLQWAHRWYWEQERGPVPVGYDLDHLCRNKPCVNPTHLEPVTKAENQRRGNASKLTWEQVDFIRANAGRMTDRALAELCNVSHGTIQNVRTYRSWWDEESRPANKET